MAIIEDVSKYSSTDLLEEAVGLIAAATYRTAVTDKNPKEAVEELDVILSFLTEIKHSWMDKIPKLSLEIATK